MKNVLFFIALIIGSSLSAQELYSDQSEGLGTMATLGMVEPYTETAMHSIFVMHGFNDYSYDLETLRYQLSEVVVDNDVTIEKVYDMSSILEPNEHILQQIVKEDKWYVLGYEKTSDSVKHYFIKELQVKNGEVEFTTDGIYSKIDSIDGKSVITKARILDEHRIAFCGAKRNPVGEESYSLFLIFDEEKEQLIEIKTPSEEETFVVKFFQDAFIANDTLYAHYAMAQEHLLVFDANYDYVEFRSLSESVSSPGNYEYSFAVSVNFNFWGNDLVFSGRSINIRRNGYAEDMYFQLYDSTFSLQYDERYFLEDRETVPIFNSFVPINNEYGVMISSSNEPSSGFGANYPHDLNLRLINKTTRETNLFRVLEEDFTHFDDAYAVDNKLLLAGYTTADSETGIRSILYYLVDYNDLITSVNEEVGLHGKMKLFPNPLKSGGILYLSWNGMEKQNWQIKFYDHKGSMVHKTEVLQGASETSIQLPELPSGNYIIRAEGSGKQVHTGTFVVE
jgi:hypothetical protein